MKKVDGLYWDEKPDWQHDKWQFQQMVRDYKICKKMIADRQWVLDIVEDLRPIVNELEVLDDVNNEETWLELMRKMVKYQAVAIGVYEVNVDE